jgi:malonyl-CoA O-methyltransferase
MQSTDKELVKNRFSANFAKYNRLALVQQRICAELAERVGELCLRPVRSALEIGIGTGFLTEKLAKSYPAAHWYLNDISPAAERFVEKQIAGAAHQYLWGDAETVAFPSGLDMIASASTVQWFDDMPAFAHKAAASTASGGYLALSSFGKDNFREIRECAGEGLEYYTAPELSQIFASAGYRILFAREYTETLEFTEPIDVLRHIKATGVNSLSRTRWSCGRMARFTDDYRRLFSTPSGSVTLTYHPILLVAEKE